MWIFFLIEYLALETVSEERCVFVGHKLEVLSSASSSRMFHIDFGGSDHVSREFLHMCNLCCQLFSSSLSK